jgi:hypothetical protein
MSLDFDRGGRGYGVTLAHLGYGGFTELRELH